MDPMFAGMDVEEEDDENAESDANAEMVVDDEALMQLVSLGFSPAASRLAFQSVGCSDTTMAAAWLLDEENGSAIAGADAKEEQQAQR